MSSVITVQPLPEFARALAVTGATLGWLLGAGTSASGGIPTAGQLFYEFKAVLYASENDAVYAKRGFYDHGMYPFVFDTMFVEEGTPCGCGYIDVMKDTQMYIDKLNQSIIKNALMATKKRYYIGRAHV